MTCACEEAVLLMLVAWPNADPAPDAADVLAVAVILTAADVADVPPSG